MHRRSVAISIMLVVLMIISVGVVNASAGNDHDHKNGRDHSKATTYHKHHKHHKGTRGDTTIKLFGQQELDEASIITADGRVFTSPDTPPEDHEITPGEVLVYRERLFKLDDRDPDNLRPRGEQIGTVVVECTVVTVGDDPEDPEDAPSVICSDVFTLEGRGDIAAADSFTFADPPEDVLPITGGTGKFRDAGGEIFLSSQQIEDTGLSNSIYTIRLLHLED